MKFIRNWHERLAAQLEWRLVNDRIEAGGQSGDLYLRRARLYLALGSPDESIRDLEDAVRVDPSLSDAWYDLGVALVNKGRFSAAIESLNVAIDLEPKAADAYLVRGDARRRLAPLDPHELAAAICDYRRAIELDENSADAYLRLGVALIDVGDAQGSLESLAQAAKKRDRDADVKCYTGEAHAALGNHEEAQRQYAEALRIAPGHVRALQNRCEVTS